MKGNLIMDYQFDTEKGKFTLYNPNTGKDWSNQLFNNESYVMTVTHFGATLSRYIDKNSVQVVVNGAHTSFVYVRDEETKQYWNITGYPSLQPISNYRCEHGQQYTTISSTYIGIDGVITYAVAPNDTREIWKVTLTNRSEKIRRLSLFGTVGFDLNGFAQPVYCSAVTMSYTDYLDGANAIVNRNLNPARPHDLSSGFILCSENVVAYDGNEEKFIGTMGTRTKPYILEQGLNCTNSLATVRTRAGILQSVIELAPGESKDVYYVIGLTENQEVFLKNRQKYLDECASIIDNALVGEQRFGKLRTQCPEEQFNRILNYWAEHQVSYCMVGKKAVRDNAQLGFSMLNFNVELAKKTIDECVAHQYADGHAVLTWYPYLEPNVYSDPSAWLVFAICEYVKETGDFAYLDKEVPYLDGGNDTVMGHMRRAVDWFEMPKNLGKHGMPRIHHADWNDALNIPDDEAESVFMAMLIAKVYGEIAELSTYLGDKAYAEFLLQRKQVLADKVNEVAWNGEYYVRAFSKFGIVGDKTSKNGGKIYVNPQSWAILADIVPEDRLQSVLNAIQSMETDEGIPMCCPPYEKYDETVGRMSSMLPGVYENAGIYNHAGCFKIMADCKLRRGEQAVATLKKVAPDGVKNPSFKTTTEPYVFTNCYLKHPTVDMQVGFSWQTGTSAWGLKCYYEGILGLQRGYDGLHIVPSIPESWKTVTATREYRGNRLHITYYNEGGLNVQMLVDGKYIAGDVVPLFDDNDEHEVVVTLKK